MMHLLAAITTDQLDVWFKLFDHVIDRLGTLALAAIAIWTKVESAANTARLDRQGNVLNEVRQALPAATADARTPDDVADAALARAVAKAKKPVMVPSDAGKTAQ